MLLFEVKVLLHPLGQRIFPGLGRGQVKATGRKLGPGRGQVKVT